VLIEEKAAAYLASHRVQLVTINGRVAVALVVPEGRPWWWAFLAHLLGFCSPSLLLAAISARKPPLDARAIVG
jgi:hypothetical protein